MGLFVRRRIRRHCRASRPGDQTATKTAAAQTMIERTSSDRCVDWKERVLRQLGELRAVRAHPVGDSECLRKRFERELGR